MERRERHARGDGHHHGQHVEQDVDRVEDAAGKQLLDPLVDHADQGRGYDREEGGNGYAAALALPLRQRLVDEDGDHAVLDQVGTLRRDGHAHEDQQVGGRDAQGDRDLGTAGPHLQPLGHDGQQHQDAAEQEEPNGDEGVAQMVDERAREAEGGVDGGDDDGRPDPEPAFPVGGEEGHEVNLAPGRLSAFRTSPCSGAPAK